MLIQKFKNGDELVLENKALIIRFTGKRSVLSTAAHNGGYREDLKWIYNQDCKLDGDKNHVMKAPTYCEHMQILSGELGLDPKYACGVITAADMENVSIKTETYADTTVTAIVTAGIDVNGGRVGDPTSWHESEVVPTPGTINIMLMIDANLPEGTMARALVTCTEAKTAALQELLAPSVYSSGIATGSGTDSTIIAADPGSKVYLTWAGKHSKLGELIGQTVMGAVKEALYLQTGLNAERQFNIFSRIGRYGITKQFLMELMKKEQVNCDDIGSKLDKISVRSELVVFTSLYVHILDQLNWGLLKASDASNAANTLLKSMNMECIDIASESILLSAYSHGLVNLTRLQ